MDWTYKADNDNELSFITLSAATRNVTRFLMNSEDVKREIVQPDKHDRAGEDRKADKPERPDIERRVRDILAMEDRLRRKQI